MKLSGLAVILIALALAAGVAFLVSDWMDAQQARVAKTEAELRTERERLEAEIEEVKKEQARLEAERGRTPEPDTAPVLVAARELPIGTQITRDDVTVRDVLPVERPGDAFVRPEEVLGNLVIREIAEGDILLPTRLSKDNRLPLMSVISEGKRAITFGIGVTAGQMRSLTPGTRVDVLLGSGGLNDAPRNRLILSNIKVLALDQSLNPRGAMVSDEMQTPGTVTLEVTPEQAKLLALAASGNNVRFLLRNQSDTRPLDTQALTLIRGTDQCDTFAGQDCQ